MSLKSIKFTKHLYQIGDETVELRGLSFNDISYLMQSRETDIDKALKFFREKSETDNIGMWLLTNVPTLIVDMICLSADEPDAIDNVSKLPISTQIELVEKVLDATFKDAGGFANFMQLVAKKLTLATGQVQAVTAGLKSLN
jgi:hypothetical protein